MNKKNKENITQYLIVLAPVLLAIGFYIVNPNFLNAMNIKNLFSDCAPLMCLCAGMAAVLILGSIDLSVGAVSTLSNVIFVFLLDKIFKSTGNIVLTGCVVYIVTILCGLLCGFLLGIVHVKFKVPSFIASLAFMQVWSSLALLISPGSLEITKKAQGIIAWYSKSVAFIGMGLIAAFIIIIIFYILESRTSYGASIYAIGLNERAARLSGLNVDFVKLMVFSLNGLCSAIGGILLSCKLKSSSSAASDSYTLMVIAATVVGGTSLSGGRGSVLKSVIGVFIVAIIKNGMNVVGVDVFWQNIIFGAIILLSISISSANGAKSLIVK